MVENREPIFAEEQKSGSDSGINVEKLIAKILAYWHLFLIFTVFSCLTAYVYLRYATPKYMAYAKVLVKDDKGGSMGEGKLMQELGMQTTTANVENEIEIFKSRTLMKKVVADQELNIHYYAPGRIKTSEYYYKDLPFRFVTLFDNNDVLYRFKYQLEIKGDGNFVISDKKKSWEGSWGDTINLPIGSVVLKDRKALANPAYIFDKYTIEIKATEYQAIKTLRLLSVKPVNKASILELSISDPLPERGEDILNELIDVYLQANIDDRNKTQDATVEFIDARLKGVSSELTGIEKNIEQFKSSRKLTDLSEQAKMLLDYSSENSKLLTEQEVKLSVIKTLEQYLQDDSNKGRIVPSSLLVLVGDNAAMSAMESYNELQLKRSSLLLTNTEQNPFIRNLDIQLESIREDMMRSLKSMEQVTLASIKALESHSGTVDAQIRKVPENERVYLEYARQQNIKQELYLFMLTKREEAAISKSSTVANARIIDPAKSDGGPYSPGKGRVYLAAIAIGLMLPGMWVFVRELLNVKVSSKDEVKKITSTSVVAEIGHNETGENIVVHKESKTVIAEQFRALRTNMQFLLADENEKIILLTSSMSGEGKSFVALNLSITLALSGAKVVLLELDLRKPKISSHLKLKDNEGFTKYIIGQASIANIIHPSGIADTLSVIPSGSIPPNPSELLLSPKLKELFEQLRNDYDYIIIDSAPVGLVTDAQLLSKYADTTLYVCRINYTYKEQLRNVEEIRQSGKMQKMNLILNDVKTKGSVYGYGYGYGNHGDDYFEDGGKNKNVFKSIKNIFNKTS